MRNGNGLGFLTVLFLVFLVLKLTDVIGWSWWWVTAPLWGGWVVFLIIMAAGAAYIAYKEFRRK